MSDPRDEAQWLTAADVYACLDDYARRHDDDAYGLPPTGPAYQRGVAIIAAALAQARREGLEEAMKVAEGFELYNDHAKAAGVRIAAAIRAKLEEVDTKRGGYAAQQQGEEP